MTLGGFIFFALAVNSNVNHLPTLRVSLNRKLIRLRKPHGVW